jgi:hypothetical protein
MVWQAVLRVPWAALAFQAESAIIALIVWRITRRHHNASCLEYAPIKARSMVRRLLRERAQDRRKIAELEAELAGARGQLAAVQQGLAKPEQTPLVYARGGWGQG